MQVPSSLTSKTSSSPVHTKGRSKGQAGWVAGLVGLATLGLAAEARAQAEPEAAATEQADAEPVVKKAVPKKKKKPVAVATTGALPAPVPAKQPPIGVAAYSWLLTINGTVMVTPDFPGASTYGFIAYPSLSFRRSDTAEGFSAPDDGVSIALLSDSRWAVGLTGRYQSGRYRADDRAKLTGIHDAKWALEPGLFGELWAVADTVRLRGEIRYGVNGYHGVVGNLSADYVARVGKWTLSAGPRMALAGKDYMETYFGVTGADAAANPRVTAYAPDAGIKSVGVAAAATYKWNDQFSTTVRGGYDRLIGSAADSPIVRNIGSRDQFSFGATASYTFDISGFGR